MLCSVLLFSVSDTASKVLTRTLPVIEIAWLRYVAFTALVIPVLVFSGPTALRSRRPGLQLLRGLGVTGSSIFFNLGVRQLAMADATAMSFASPLFITALSIPLLGEKVGLRRWAAVVVGLLGILIVARPGSGALGSAAIFPLLSSMSWSTAIILTRKTSAFDGAPVMLAYAAGTGIIVLSLMLPAVWIRPNLEEIALGLFVGLASTGGHFLLIPAYRRANASVLAPFSYSQIIWASILGYLVFDALPDRMTLAGAAVVAACGVYTAHRERVAARRKAAALSA